MKVNIYETVEVSDEQRIEIAKTIDDAGAKKRQATREELKDYIWTHGAYWADDLAGVETNGEGMTDVDDILGDVDEAEDDDLESLI